MAMIPPRRLSGKAPRVSTARTASIAILRKPSAMRPASFVAKHSAHQYAPRPAHFPAPEVCHDQTDPVRGQRGSRASAGIVRTSRERAQSGGLSGRKSGIILARTGRRLARKSCGFEKKWQPISQVGFTTKPCLLAKLASAAFSFLNRAPLAMRGLHSTWQCAGLSA